MFFPAAAGKVLLSSFPFDGSAQVSAKAVCMRSCSFSKTILDSHLSKSGPKAKKYGGKRRQSFSSVSVATAGQSFAAK